LHRELSPCPSAEEGDVAGADLLGDRFFVDFCQLRCHITTTRRRNTCFSRKGFVPLPKESMAFQSPASGLRIPRVLCTNSYLIHSDDNDDCHQAEFTHRNLPLSKGV